MVDLVSRLRAAGCVFAEEEAELLADAPEELIARRVAGEPLETILGWVEFAGMRVSCRPGVFVPRVRSELLVRLAAEALGADGGHRRARPISPRVLDLGCGTGALGAAVGARVPAAQIWAVDIDPAAVACARLNLPTGRVLAGDLFEPLQMSSAAGEPPRFEVIIANAPYVPTEQIPLMPPEARDHEHRVALDGGADGLAVQRRVIAAAPQWLTDGGILLVESSSGQASRTRHLMEQAGLRATIVSEEEIAATVVRGRN